MNKTYKIKTKAICISTVLFCLYCVGPAFAGRVFNISTNREFTERVRSAKPGDLILIEPGVYRGGFSFQGISGTAEEPILIRGSDPANPPVIRGGTNGIRLTGCKNVSLEDLVFEDCAVHGVQIDYRGDWKPGDVAGISLCRLVIRRIGDLGNEDGIKCTGVWGLRIQDCTIQRWGRQGRSIDLVCCRDVVVLRCVFDGANHSRIAFQIKGGSTNAMIDRCFVKRTLERGYQIGGSTDGLYFLTGFEGFEAKLVKLKNSVTEGGETGFAFVNALECSVENCLFIRPKTWCLRVLQENNLPDAIPCGNNNVKQNIFVFHSHEIRNRFDIGEGTDPSTVLVSDNLWYDAACIVTSPSRTTILESGSIFDIDPKIWTDEQGVPKASRTFEDLHQMNVARRFKFQEGVSTWQVLAFIALCIFASLPLRRHGDTVSIAPWLQNGLSVKTIGVFLGGIICMYVYAQLYSFDSKYEVDDNLAYPIPQGDAYPPGMTTGQSVSTVLVSGLLGFVTMLGVRVYASVFWYRSILRVVIGMIAFASLLSMDWICDSWFGANITPSSLFAPNKTIGLCVGCLMELLFGPSLLKFMSFPRRRSNIVDHALFFSFFAWATHALSPFRLQIDPLDIYYKFRSGLVDLDGNDLMRMGLGAMMAEIIRNIPLGILLSRFAVRHPENFRSLRSSLALAFILLLTRETVHFFIAFRGVSVSICLISMFGVSIGAFLNQWITRRQDWWTSCVALESKVSRFALGIFVSFLLVCMVNPFCW
jgi:hypothetical protein